MINRLIPRLATGPEDPLILIQQAVAILDSQHWKFYMAYSIGGTLCGLMALFLICVSIWRPTMVNRVSLRLIFAITVYDFIVCVIQASANSRNASARCRATIFFSSFFGYASVYTSSSIAFNLYMTLLRNTRSNYLPKYVECLYYAVPLLVALCQWLPPTIWAAVNGYCSAFEPIETGTMAYILYVVFLQLLIPLCALLFNIIVSCRVVTMLLLEQRQVNQSLREIMQQTYDRLFGTKRSIDNGCVMSETVRNQLEINLLVMRKFNSAAIRIALYPCAPIAWWIINAIYYAMQYSLTMTFENDVGRWVKMASLAWFSMPAIAIANFLVFVTDPAFVKVVKEVYRHISSKSQWYRRRWTGSQKEFSSFNQPKDNNARKAYYSDMTMGASSFDQETLTGTTFKQPQYKNTQRQPFAPSIADSINIGEADGGILESPVEHSSVGECTTSMFDSWPGGETGSSATSHSTAVISPYGEMIRRHPTTGNRDDANHFYSRI
ncbi:hypothetical protein BX070DRAFT_231250 [Coemansia spiralis]|nr:hypothetical protein BX070DRAFT_231250 [Coemansia spiralis]